MCKLSWVCTHCSIALLFSTSQRIANHEQKQKIGSEKNSLMVHESVETFLLTIFSIFGSVWNAESVFDKHPVLQAMFAKDLTSFVESLKTNRSRHCFRVEDHKLREHRNQLQHDQVRLIHVQFEETRVILKRLSSDHYHPYLRALEWSHCPLPPRLFQAFEVRVGHHRE